VARNRWSDWRAVVLLTSPFLTATLVFGCSSAQHQAEEKNRTVRSWEATIQLTRELRDRGVVPAEYAEQTTAAAEKELEKVHRKTGGSSQ
jgi:hypothetical protein